MIANKANKKFKIVAKLFGGLGNQLFIYAAARRLALFNNSQLFLDISSGFANDHVYKRTCQLYNFKINAEICLIKNSNNFLVILLRRFHIIINFLIPFKFKYYIKQNGSNFEIRIFNYKQKYNLYLEGYWQSERYFADIDNLIRSELEIIPPTDKTNNVISNYIKSSVSICVHIRFFNEDDIQNSLDISNYLIKSFDLVESRIKNPRYFIFSNDFSRARMLSILESRDCTFIDNNLGDDKAYADLWLMTLCKHHIISNSTFSWWGAWLANNKYGLVISPNTVSRNGVISWGFDGNLPTHWIKIEV
ncbi:alpha-1,2-fucosyltransferase [Polynucleobacter paneuropaeus]|nr:alpha-1,2-fucosyltransferase [Polynucleobacter paneuropaeus]